MHGVNDTNVQQYTYNGSSAQKWYMSHLGNGEYMIFTDSGSTYSNGTHWLNYALDVYCGYNSNNTNIQIYSAISNNNAQIFSFSKTSESTYIIYTKASNYTKVVSLADNLCNNGINVHQWEYSNHSHDEWILEPIDPIISMGVSYAEHNYNTYVDAYPEFQSPYYDCTNYLSQCLLAGGQLHQNSPWYIRRVNTTYHAVSNSTQLDTSWDLADPSPWISAKQFKNTFYNDRHVAHYKGQDIINNITTVWNLSIYNGDVIQIADNFLGLVLDAEHSMYITGYSMENVTGQNAYSYDLTYHSSNTLDKNLATIANSSNYSNKWFIFYDFTD